MFTSVAFESLFLHHSFAVVSITTFLLVPFHSFQRCRCTRLTHLAPSNCRDPNCIAILTLAQGCGMLTASKASITHINHHQMSSASQTLFLPRKLMLKMESSFILLRSPLEKSIAGCNYHVPKVGAARKETSKAQVCLFNHPRFCQVTHH